jgi:hypothetical protein
MEKSRLERSEDKEDDPEERTNGRGWRGEEELRSWNERKGGEWSGVFLVCCVSLAYQRVPMPALHEGPLGGRPVKYTNYKGHTNTIPHPVNFHCNSYSHSHWFPLSVFVHLCLYQLTVNIYSFQGLLRN